MYQTKFDVYFGKQVKLNKKHTAVTGFSTTPTLEIVIKFFKYLKTLIHWLFLHMSLLLVEGVDEYSGL